MEFADVSCALITREASYPRDANPPMFGFNEIRIRNHSPNVLERYKLAAQCTTPHVYVQDDDIYCDKLPELWAEYSGHELLTIMPPGNYTPAYRGTGVTLVGFGALFPTQWARNFLAKLDQWEGIFPRIVVEEECDRLFTWVYRKETRNLLTNVRQFQRPVQMHDRPAHYATLASIVKKLKELE